MDIVARPSPSYSITIRLQYPNREGMLGKVTSVIGDAGGDIGAVDIVESRGNRITRDITIDARDERHSGVIVERVRAIEDLKVVNVSDMTFLRHLGGKLEVRAKYPLKTRSDLSMA